METWAGASYWHTKPQLGFSCLYRAPGVYPDDAVPSGVDMRFVNDFCSLNDPPGGREPTVC